MQSLGRCYVRYINTTYRRTGTLWQGRFMASIVDSDAYLLTCTHYIELNPVFACMVDHPVEYRWSSYTANARGEKDFLITPNRIYTALDKMPSKRQHTYREFGLLQHYDANENLRSCFEQVLDESVEVYNQYHALIVVHAKDICQKQPQCQKCCLAEDCIGIQH